MTTQHIIENKQRDELRRQFSDALRVIEVNNDSIKFDSNSSNVGDLIHGGIVCSYACFTDTMNVYFYKRSEGRQQDPHETFDTVWADENSMCWQDQSGIKYTSEQLAQHCLTTLLRFR